MQEVQCKWNNIVMGDESGKKDNLLMENGQSVECVEACCYLGDMLSSGGGAEEAASEDQVCLEEIQRAVSNTDSKRRIS